MLMDALTNALYPGIRKIACTIWRNAECCSDPHDYLMITSSQGFIEIGWSDSKYFMECSIPINCGLFNEKTNSIPSRFVNSVALLENKKSPYQASPSKSQSCS
jgi:hypothetical protein